MAVRSCSILAGGRVVGQVLPFGEAGLNGATIQSPTGSFATPADFNLGDGLFMAFAPPGEQSVTVVDSGVSRSVSVVADQTVRLDIFLDPGRVFLPVLRRCPNSLWWCSRI